jgi:hypothetical protein
VHDGLDGVRKGVEHGLDNCIPSVLILLDDTGPNSFLCSAVSHVSHFAESLSPIEEPRRAPP